MEIIQDQLLMEFIGKAGWMNRTHYPKLSYEYTILPYNNSFLFAHNAYFDVFL